MQPALLQLQNELDWISQVFEEQQETLQRASYELLMDWICSIMNKSQHKEHYWYWTWKTILHWPYVICVYMFRREELLLLLFRLGGQTLHRAKALPLSHITGQRLLFPASSGPWWLCFSLHITVVASDRSPRVTTSLCVVSFCAQLLSDCEACYLPGVTPELFKQYTKGQCLIQRPWQQQAYKTMVCFFFNMH